MRVKHSDKNCAANVCHWRKGRHHSDKISEVLFFHIYNNARGTKI